jgi:hypothetical protein
VEVARYRGVARKKAQNETNRGLECDPIANGKSAGAWAPPFRGGGESQNPSGEDGKTAQEVGPSECESKAAAFLTRLLCRERPDRSKAHLEVS